MAQATVNLKVAPHELQVIREALKVYAWKMRTLSGQEYEPAPQLDILGGDPRALALTASKIMNDIGLK